MAEKIEACLFCNAKCQTIPDGRPPWSRVSCGCGYRGPRHPTPEEAIAVHNTASAKMRLFKQLFDLAEGWRGGPTTAAIVAKARALLEEDDHV